MAQANKAISVAVTSRPNRFFKNGAVMSTNTASDRNSSKRRRIAIAIGDPNGIGPEIALKAAVAQIPNVATEPAPEVNLLDFQLQGPVIAVRPYTHTDHYWQVYFDTNEAIARVGKEAGWAAPTPVQIMKTVAGT